MTKEELEEALLSLTRVLVHNTEVELAEALAENAKLRVSNELLQEELDELRLRG